MSQWSSAKAKRVLAALLRIGWSIKRESGSHKILSRLGWPDVVFALHDKDEIGPKMLAASPGTQGSNPKICSRAVLSRAAQQSLQLTAR
jgi:predicted RNA binding protein YcfA (HicA-like mRNA interferase family)